MEEVKELILSNGENGVLSILTHCLQEYHNILCFLMSDHIKIVQKDGSMPWTQ